MSRNATTEGAGRARIGRAKKLLFLSFLLAAVVLAAEAATRLFQPQEVAPIMNVLHPALGETAKTDHKGRHKGIDFTYSFSTDSRGARGKGHEVPKPPGIFRILCLGDSFTFGVGVSDDQTFAAVLERSLNRSGGRRFDVVNAGTCGWGTAHEAAYLALEGLKYDPDLTILTVCGNDLSDTVVSGLYTLEDGKLASHPPRMSRRIKLRAVVEKVPLYDFLVARSHLLALVRRATVHRLEAKARTPSGHQAEQVQNRRLLTALVLRIWELSSKRLIVVFVSDPQAMRERAIGSGFMEALWDVLKAKGIPVISASQLLASAGLTPEQAHFVHDLHWTPAAHKAIGEELSRIVLEAAGRAQPKNAIPAE